MNKIRCGDRRRARARAHGRGGGRPADRLRRGRDEVRRRRRCEALRRDERSCRRRRTASPSSGTPTLRRRSRIRAFLDRMIPVAEANDIQVVFAIYPAEGDDGADDPGGRRHPSATTPSTVMQRYPYVRKVIIGNEPNQPRFWQPIWNGSTPASPAAMEVVLASCYDKLEGVRPDARRDRRRPLAARERRSGRLEQLVDLAGALDQGARRRVSRERPPEAALRRVVVALLSEREHRRGRDRLRVAEHRLRERRAREARALGRLQRHRPADAPRLSGEHDRLDALRRHVADVHRRDRLAGRHARAAPATSTPRTCRSVSREAKQAEDYEKLVHLANCEPTLTAFHIFHEIDESDRGGLPERRSPRRLQRVATSALATPFSVQHAIVADNGACSGGVWQTLGSFLYSTERGRARLPDASRIRAGSPMRRRQSAAAASTSRSHAGEGFTYTHHVQERRAGAASAKGAAPTDDATR